MTRGYTDEGDRILNYLVYAPLSHKDPCIVNNYSMECGISDALEKNYLQYLVWDIWSCCLYYALINLVLQDILYAPYDWFIPTLMNSQYC